MVRLPDKILSPEGSVRKIILIVLVVVFFLPQTIQAQENLVISNMQLDLWPEYDHSSMLVIYRITLSPDTTFPADVVFRIPVAAGMPHAVAAGSSDMSVGDVLYEREEVGEWAVLRFAVNGPALRLEYYDPSLTVENPARQFVYTWPGDYPVEEFKVKVQQPVEAEGMVISPSLGNGSLNTSDGLYYYETSLGSMNAGETFDISIEYQKNSATLTIETLPLQPGQPVNEGTQGRVNLQSIMPWILGIMGFLLIGGGVYWYWQSGKEPARPSRRRRPRGASAPRITTPKKTAPSEKPLSEEGDVYCHMCGKRASDTDRFCRSCGTPLRSE